MEANYGHHPLMGFVDHGPGGTGEPVATLTAAGQLVTTGRRRILRLARHWPWTGQITAALDSLTQLPDPD
ncbi:hypothetical protein JS756_24275 [Streptomyces actuosus]|uniref:Uncharacterized protein n=1 Tax=Streptomyces actuosus TaxID=1885 RepID=A0ABS2VVM0_STRAS|nr:hypothetical protein [Streptomyces actuosus]MBN0047167.1 hypothetical protein [Streptomyces actuosus]